MIVTTRSSNMKELQSDMNAALQLPPPVTIVLAEDDPGHARLVERNLRRAGINNEIVNVGNGQAAMDYVLAYAQSARGTMHRQLLMLLDLNMPIMDGYEVLATLKGNPATQRIPVIVLTTTDVPEDVARCYDLGCNVFITKPVEFNAFAESVRRVGLLLSVIAIPDMDG